MFSLLLKERIFIFYLTKIAIFEIFLEIQSQSLETHLSYHFKIKMGFFLTQENAAKFLSVK